MKKLFLLMVALLTLTGLGGCASVTGKGTWPGLPTRLVYAVVKTNETCGLKAPAFGLSFSNRDKTGPYRMTEAVAYDTGNNWASAIAAAPLIAYVPDGTPRLKDGDIVLIRMGDASFISGFDYEKPTPFDGSSNTVITRVYKSGWDGIGSPYANRPTVGHHQSPWKREPWSESVKQYNLHFTKFWKVDKRAHTCLPLRPFPKTPSAGRTGLPDWPARSGD